MTSAAKHMCPSFEEFLMDAADFGWLPPMESGMLTSLAASSGAKPETIAAALTGMQSALV